MSIGKGLGSALGSALLPGAGGTIGGALGSGLGWAFNKITGMGDYKVRMNSLVKAGPVPQFGDNCIRLKHREYLGDISSTTGFSNASYPIQPGNPVTFPWLSSVAANYEEYMFLGCVFYFVSTSATALNSTNTALGKLIMATEYDAQKAAFTNPSQMLATEFSNYGKPAEDLMHAVECDPALRPVLWQYVRTAAVPSGSDSRLYDLGIFQLASQGMQAAANIGGLWVSYDVIFCKPIIAPQGGLEDRFNQPVTTVGLSPIWTTTLNTGRRPVGCTINGNIVSFPTTITSGVYRISVISYSPGAATSNVASIGTFVNCTQVETNGGMPGVTNFTTETGSSNAAFYQETNLSITGAGASFTVTTTSGSQTNRMTLRVTYTGTS